MHLYLGILLIALKTSVQALPAAATVIDVPTPYTDGPFQITTGALLREASRNGNISGVIEMLSGGLNVDDADAKGWTGLMWASRYGHEPIVDYLLEQGADEDHQSNTGDSSLLWASYGGFTSIVVTFLDMEVNPDIKEEKGTTPLMAAAIAGQLDVVEMLLDKGADKTIRDKLGFNALILATRTGKKEVIILLNDYLAVNTQDNLGWTPLHHLVSLNTSSGAEIMTELLNFCPDLELVATIGANNWTAIDFAIGMNNDYAFSTFQEHFGKLSATCILDLEEYSFPEVAYFDCRQFQCHCYGHWEPIGTNPDCREITLEVLASQDLTNNDQILSLPDI